MTKSEAIFPARRQALYDMHRYSAAIRSGDLLFISGQVGAREDGSPEPDFGSRLNWPSTIFRRCWRPLAARLRTSLT